MMEPIPGKKMLMMSRSRPHDFVSTFGTSCFLQAQNTSTSKTTLCTSSAKVFSSMCAGRKTAQTFTRFTVLSLVGLFALTRSRPTLLGKDSTFLAFYFDFGLFFSFFFPPSISLKNFFLWLCYNKQQFTHYLYTHICIPSRYRFIYCS